MAAVTCPCGVPLAEPAPPPRIEWCPRCGTGATIPPPGRDVSGDGLFEDADAGYGGQRLDYRDQWFHDSRVRVRWVRRRLRSGRLLEIGPATGEFVAVAQDAGYDVIGLETSPWAAQQAATITDRVYCQTLAEWVTDHPGDRFDAVCMFHVLEHFDEPAAFLRELRGVVRPGGLVLLEVPNGGSWTAREHGIDWSLARPEDHHFHFTADGLKRLADATGWRLVNAATVGENVYANMDQRTRSVAKLKDIARPLFGRRRHPKNLLRAVLTH